ncbi:hypothetical protein Hdeb2414_s0008g00290141 [Helianthus debilis subsp. tardiflorus]
MLTSHFSSLSIRYGVTGLWPARPAEPATVHGGAAASGGGGDFRRNILVRTPLPCSSPTGTPYFCSIRLIRTPPPPEGGGPAVRHRERQRERLRGEREREPAVEDSDRRSKTRTAGRFICMVVGVIIRQVSPFFPVGLVFIRRVSRWNNIRRLRVLFGVRPWFKTKTR